MNDNENRWDKLLKIRTSGRDDSQADQFHYPYEPTPYSVLERLSNSGYIRKSNTLLDYGCGKGRVDFFLSWQTRCRSIGVEYDERIYNSAMKNHKRAFLSGKVSFKLESAETFSVPPEVDCCYFFNPFSETILQRVYSNILESWYENPREILLFFYYPSDEYIAALMRMDQLMFLDEIDCRDLFDGNDERERIMVFQLS